MTKLELIEAFAAFPDDKVVVMDGYEGGFADVWRGKLWGLSYQHDLVVADSPHRVTGFNVGAKKNSATL